MHPVQGLVYVGRQSVTDEKSEFARAAQQGSDFAGVTLEHAISKIQPTAVIGATAKRGTFSQAVVQTLTKVSLTLAGQGRLYSFCPHCQTFGVGLAVF